MKFYCSEFEVLFFSYYKILTILIRVVFTIYLESKCLKEHWKTILGFLVGIFVFTAILVPLGIYYRNKNFNPQNIGYVFIDENIDFKLLNLPGSGTVDDPYLIENYHFSDQNYAIYINGTTKCFIIQNCIISSSNYAIYLENIKDCSVIIQNNLCSDCQNSVVVEESNSVTVRNNTCKNTERGFSITSSTNILVSDNVCFNNTRVGITFSYSTFIRIEKNTITYCRSGISCYGIDNSILRNNTCSYCDYECIKISSTKNSLIENNTIAFGIRAGLELYIANNNSISGNQFFSCGLNPFTTYDDTYSQNKITNNLVNNKPLGYFENLTNEVFSEPNYGQLFFINCSNLVLQNQNLTSASLGLTLYRCKNTTIQNNVCNNNSYSGIFVRDSQKMIIYNNTCNFNKREPDSSVGRGIETFNISGLFLINNTCLSNHCGIDLRYSHNAIIANNTCATSFYGFYLSDCINASIFANNFNNNLLGINLWDSEFCVIIYNLFSKNSKYGLRICDGDNNTIHHNNFIQNNLVYSPSQAYDSGDNNLWYDNSTNEGNYWSNWLGSGNYSIDGFSNAADLYPLSSVVVFVNLLIFFKNSVCSTS